MGPAATLNTEHNEEQTFLFMGALPFLVLTSCSLTRTQRIGLPESSRAARSLVATIRDHVEGKLLQYVGVNHSAVVATLTGPETFPANFKQTPVLQTLADPWKGMAVLEQHGSRWQNGQRVARHN